MSVIVKVFAKVHGPGTPAHGATITDLHNSDITGIVDEKGYVEFNLEPGSTFTPVLTDLRTLENPRDRLLNTQGPTFTISEDGHDTPETKLTIQTGYDRLYRNLSRAFGGKQEGADLFGTLNTAFATLENDSGLEGAEVWLETPDGKRLDHKPHYVGYWHSPAIRRFLAPTGTNWFDPLIAYRLERHLPSLSFLWRNDKTSKDGGVFFRGVPEGQYYIVAEKDGVDISRSALITIDGSKPADFYNLGPPYGPKEMAPSNVVEFETPQILIPEKAPEMAA